MGEWWRSPTGPGSLTLGVRSTLRKQRSRFDSGQGDIGSGEVQFMLFVAAGLSVVFFGGTMGHVGKVFSHEAERNLSVGGAMELLRPRWTFGFAQ